MTINTVMSVDQESNITLNTTTTEMLRVAKDGFYVRGKRVNQDDKEAEIVYNAFHQWLTWATLNRNF
jgi:hypothetical protein